MSNGLVILITLDQQIELLHNEMQNGTAHTFHTESPELWKKIFFCTFPGLWGKSYKGAFKSCLIASFLSSPDSYLMVLC